MIKRRADLVRLLMWLGVAGCSSVDPKFQTMAGDPVQGGGVDPTTPIDGCDGSAASMAGSGLHDGVLNLNVDTVPLVITAPNGVLAANTIPCTQTVSGVQKPLKTSDVQRIVVVGSAADNQVVIDLLNGGLGNGILAANGGVLVDFASHRGGNDSFTIRASARAETYKFAAAPVGSTPTDVYIEISGDKRADIDIEPGATGTFSLIASMGDGNDTVIANADSNVIDSYSDQNGLVVGPLPAGLGLTAYGGAGDDKFIGGFGDDAFYGGAGNDTFQMNDTSDGADIYSGDDGIDLVDYSVRGDDLAIDLGPPRPAIHGQVDLASPSLYGGGGSLNNKTLAFVIDATRIEYTFAAPSDPGVLLAGLNAAANGALRTSHVNYASLVGQNRLTIMSGTNRADSFVKIEDDPAIAASGASGAEGPLGLATGAAVSFPLVGVDLSQSSLYGASAALDGHRLVLSIDGVYVAVPFVAPTDSNAVLNAINAAANSALDTSNVAYATRNATTQRLELKSTALTVLDGSLAQSLPHPSAAGLLGFDSIVEGNVDLSTAAHLFGSGQGLAGATLAIVIDGARIEAALGTPSTASALVDAIDRAAQAVFGTGDSYASLTPSHHLMIASRTALSGVSSVSVAGNANIAAAAHGVSGAEVPLHLSTGVGASTLVGTDLSAGALYGSQGSLANTRLVLVVDGEYIAIALSAPTDANALLSAINSAADAALGTSRSYARENATTHALEIAASWVAAKDGTAAQNYSASAPILLGLANVVRAHRDLADADDGSAGEHDDVRDSTENVIGGPGNDVIIGNELKNSIKGGDGDDVLSGGSNTDCSTTAGDALSGGAGDDRFVSPMADCNAAMSGGTGTNVADFSGRSADVSLKNNGIADDGENGENANIAVDITHLIGGFGDDNLTGGASDDRLIGGPGADVLVGGAGTDTLDYSGSPAAVDVTLCFAASLGACGVANDGASGEGDQAYQFEHLIGSAFNDALSGATATTTQLVIEGGPGDDVITGGAASDMLWGDSGNDTLHGGPGEDNLSGDAGDDALDGGDGDGDICLTDGADVSHRPISCELS